jgi:hypothetical protein
MNIINDPAFRRARSEVTEAPKRQSGADVQIHNRRAAPRRPGRCGCDHVCFSRAMGPALRLGQSSAFWPPFTWRWARLPTPA